MLHRMAAGVGMATGVGALLGKGLFPDIAQAADKPLIKTVGGPKRVIFFCKTTASTP